MKKFFYLLISVFLFFSPVFAGPIHDAVEKGDVKKAVALLDKYDSLKNERNDYGWTPLHIAANNKNFTMIRMLLEYDADVNATANNGQTPLHKACYSSFTKGALCLINAGSDVNARTPNGVTPLMAAAYAGDKQIIYKLVSNGADVNVFGVHIAVVFEIRDNGAFLEDIARRCVDSLCTTVGQKYKQNYRR